MDRQGSLRECSDGMRTALNLRCMLARSRALMLMLLTAWRPDSPLSRAVRAHMSQDAPRSSTTRGGVSSSTRRARSAPPSPPHSLFAACTGRAPPSMHRLVVPARALLGMGCPDGSRAREQHVGTELPHWQTRAQTPDGSARVWRRSVVLCACVPFRSLSLSAVFSGVSTRGLQSVADSLGVRWTWPGIRVRIVQGSCGQWAEHAARAASHACLARFGSGTGEAHLHAERARGLWQCEGLGATREVVGGAPSSHTACYGWARCNGSPAGSPRVGLSGVISSARSMRHEVGEIARGR